MQQDREVLSCT